MSSAAVVTGTLRVKKLWRILSSHVADHSSYVLAYMEFAFEEFTCQNFQNKLNIDKETLQPIALRTAKTLWPFSVQKG